ncbi:hypothetical protein Zmor_019022 [Zophobas morio]|uniref:Uncharacterized protein n=1 Tax=Zophobas morio TaxID=2755281 RepID=A0AA38MDN8_9CUCU|nr:hypothetical protein Zmor_019022 [Zophobas morio]
MKSIIFVCVVLVALTCLATEATAQRAPPNLGGYNGNARTNPPRTIGGPDSVYRGGNRGGPQIPSLQTLRIPSPNQRIPLSLKMMDTSQFRMTNPQIRNLPPNQNQSVRNIQNPSFLVWQQQNRLNSMNPPIRENNNGEK